MRSVKAQVLPRGLINTDDSIMVSETKNCYRTHPSHDEIWFHTSSALFYYRLEPNRKTVSTPASSVRMDHALCGVCHVTKNFE